MIDTTSSDMKDTVLHKIFNKVNSQPRNNIREVAHGIGEINNQLSLKHIIQEPESTRANIDDTIFNKMTEIENAIGKSELSIFLGKYHLQKTAEVQSAKNAIKEAVQSAEKDDIVNDVLGG